MKKRSIIGLAALAAAGLAGQGLDAEIDRAMKDAVAEQISQGGNCLGEKETIVEDHTGKKGVKEVTLLCDAYDGNVKIKGYA